MSQDNLPRVDIVMCDPSKVTKADMERIWAATHASSPQLLEIEPAVVVNVEPRLFSDEERQPAADAPITDQERATYGDLASLASGHESDRQIAARVVWLDRDALDHQAVLYAARDRIMHLAVRVADLEAQLAAKEPKA